MTSYPRISRSAVTHRAGKHGVPANVVVGLLESLGLTVEPEKPAPGMWQIVFDGPPEAVSGRFVEVEDHNGASINAGEWVDRKDGTWALVVDPARVAPESEWARVNTDEDVLAKERDKWRDLAEMRNAKLGILQAELSDAMDTLTELAPAEPALPDPLTEEQVGELWDKVTDSGVSDWIDYRTPLRGAIKRTVNAARMVPAEPVAYQALTDAEIQDLDDGPLSYEDDLRKVHRAGWDAALAKQGTGRQATREQVEAAIEPHMPLAKWDVSGPKLVEAVMDLLNGGGTDG